MKTTNQYINLSLKGFLEIADSYTLPIVDGSFGYILATDGVGGVTWQDPNTLVSLTTDDVTEATNLYYTDEKVDDRVSSLIQNGTGLTWSYNDIANTLTGNISLSPFNTGNLAEGVNLYFTNERVDDRVSVLIKNGTGISWLYNDIAGTLTPTITLSPFTTDNLAEGSTNKYFTNEAIDDRVSALIQNGTGITWTYNDPANTLTGNVSLSAFSTSNLSEGTNLYFTNERVDDRVANLIQNSATITWTYNDGLNTLTADASASPIGVEKNGTLISTRNTINFIEGTGVTFTIADNGANNRADVTIDVSTGGAISSVYSNNIQVGDSDIENLNFSNKFSVIESPDKYVTVDVSMLLEELSNVTLSSPILDGDLLMYNFGLGIWENGQASNIYNSDGNLTSNRFIELNGFDIEFVNSATVGQIFKLDATTGKVTIPGLLDPTGLQLTSSVANPGTIQTLWVNSLSGNTLQWGAVPVIQDLQSVLNVGNTSLTTTSGVAMTIVNNTSSNATAAEFIVAGSRLTGGTALISRAAGSAGTNTGLYVESSIEGANRNYGISVKMTAPTGYGNNFSYYDIGGLNPLNINIEDSDLRGFSLETGPAFNTTTGRITGFYMDLTSGSGNKSFMQLIDGTEAAGKVLTSDANGFVTWQTPIPTVSNLDDLADVDTTTTPPVDGDILVYNGSPGEWVPSKPKRSWQWGASNNTNTTNTYLKAHGSSFTNSTPYIAAFDCKITAISASTNGIETWGAEIHVNGSNVGSLIISAADSGYASPLSIPVLAGDKISFYCNGTTINSPMITCWFEEA